VFLTAFDVLSVVERKNPGAVVNAFRLACTRNKGLRLVVKVNNARLCSEAVQVLRQAAGDLPVTFLEETLDRDEMNALIAVCDCFVSLHRSEGFGLALAEAMAFGKPVIATAYSGNMDFTTPSNAFLVSYSMTRVGTGCGPYDPEGEWTEPDVHEAARQMKLVVECQDAARKRAVAGQEFVRNYLSPEVIGAKMRQRLERIQLSPPRSRKPGPERDSRFRK
jgi:glycosyltransferase involved in cell wall biosynthesis